MTAILTSSPFVCNAPRAILNPENGLLDHLYRLLPDHPRCLFICSDPDTPDLTDSFARDVAEAFGEADLEFADLWVLDRRNQEDAQLLIWESDIIVMAGGHVPTQNRFFQEINLKELIRNYQGLVFGISAGTMNCAGRVYSQPEEPGESAPEFERFLPGLGLTNINVLPHYQQVKDNMLDGMRLFEDVTYADSWGECFFSFVDGTYILIEDGVQMIFGQCGLIKDGKREEISKLNEIVIVE